MSGNINMQAVLKLLELPMDSANPLINILNSNPSVAQPFLTKFKLLIRKQRRILAKKYHPDIYKDGDNRMKRINNIIDMLLKSRIMLPQPVVIRTYHFHASYHYSGYGGSGASTTTSAVWS